MAKCRELTRCSAQTAVSTGCFTNCTQGSPRRPEAVSSKPKLIVTPALAATIRVGSSPSYSRARLRSHKADRSRKLPHKNSSNNLIARASFVENCVAAQKLKLRPNQPKAAATISHSTPQEGSRKLGPRFRFRGSARSWGCDGAECVGEPSSLARNRRDGAHESSRVTALGYF